MHLTLLLAGALIPEEISVAITASLNLPNLQARLTRARLIETAALQSDTGDAHLDWLGLEMFDRVPAPTAPYAYAQLCGKPAATLLWHADPVHIEIARDHLIVLPLGDDIPTTAESALLIEAANSLTFEVNCELIEAGGRWFLKTDREWNIDTRPLTAVTGLPMVLPTGADAHMWNKLHTEVQMMWHTHPVNQAREERRLPAINGIWLHGGGRWHSLPPLRFAQVQADAPEWRGAAQAAGVPGEPSGAGVIDGSLLVIDDPLSPRKVHDWSAWSQALLPVDQRLAAHARDSVDLILCGSTVRTFQSRLSDRYVPWRRRSIVEALAE